MRLSPDSTPIPLDGTGERMAALVASFPCLRGQTGASPFDARTLIHVVIRNGMGDEDEQMAVGFLVWLTVEGLRHVQTFDRFKHSIEHGVSSRFSLTELAFLGSVETRSAVAAWLADPWLPRHAAPT